MLARKGFRSVAAEGFQAPGVVVSYTEDAEIQNGKKFLALGLQTAAGVPLQCEDRYVNPACAPGYLGVDFTRTTPTHYLFEATALWRAQYSIEAARPTRQEARLHPGSI